MEIRPHRPDDLAAVQRIWREVGWVGKDDVKHVEPFLADADAIVAVVDGEAESCVTIHDGTIRHQATDLPVAVVTSVVVSRIARRRGLAGRLTARQLVAAAGRGNAWAALGMFDQGFYDRLGFGSGTPLVRHQFDPATLTVDLPDRAPVRVAATDVDEVHAAWSGRWRAHGGVTVRSRGFVQAELGWTEESFGLGFRDDAGRLTDMVWGSAKGEHGPYQIGAFAHEDDAGLLRLLGLLRQLGDQVRVVWLPEPAGVVLEDLLDQPSRHRFATKGAEHPVQVTSGAWWQARVLDVPAAVAAHRWPGEPLRFVLELGDPLAAHDEVAWDGCHGRWLIELGAPSSAARGEEDGLPVLTAGVGSFSRMLLGVAPATTLARTTDLAGPAELLLALDEALRLPPPHPGMFF